MDNPYLSDLKVPRPDKPYFQFPGLSSHPGLRHGVFTRLHGVSDPPFDTLNISYAVGDRPEQVKENIKKIRDVSQAEEVCYSNQAHGKGIFVLDHNFSVRPHAAPEADAMITNIPRIALLVAQADCQGTIIYDPKRNVVANVHCGWRGNVQDILGCVVIRMRDEFGCKESDLIAAIGPSLGPCCAEFVGYRDIFPETFEGFMVRENYFDFWALSRHQLQEVGLRPNNIEVAGICNRCRTDLFFSYRSEGKTGRFGTVAMLK